MRRIVAPLLLYLLLFPVSGSLKSIFAADDFYNDNHLADDYHPVKMIGGVEMVLISGGDMPDFWISIYEVTQKLYTSVMRSNRSFFKGDNLPVEHVSWFDAVEFCNRLSIKAGLKPYYNIDKKNNDLLNKNTGIRWVVTIVEDSDGFRLPASGEWELAARGNGSTRYSWGEKMDGDYCWYRENSQGRTHPVGSKKPNVNGIYDTCGNVWEWCFDWHSSYYGLHRVIRDGHYNLSEDEVHPGRIYHRPPQFEFGFIGIRLARNK